MFTTHDLPFFSKLFASTFDDLSHWRRSAGKGIFIRSITEA